MNAVVKFHNIKQITENRDGTVTIYYTHSLSFIKAMKKANGQSLVKLGDVYTLTVEKGQLVELHV